jgi:ABC-type multidrug transport system ATPase subunit/ABC-type multidrug transport system permease subunit
MSMTCSVGQCLYNSSNATQELQPPAYKERQLPDGLAPQLSLLGFIAAGTIFFFLIVDFVRRISVFRGDYLYTRSIKGGVGPGGNGQAAVAEPLLSENEKEFPSTVPDRGAEVEWSNVNLWVPDHTLGRGRRRGSTFGERQILHDVNGKAPEGSVTALMGPSGAGKTSLLDCLAARKSMHKVQRQVTVNGGNCSPKIMQAISGYVEQHDILPSMFRVREHLLFHARLRCGRMSSVHRRARVENVINTLGLAKCADTIIGGESRRGLSGGERRRLSVAEELLVEPRILFLDEPTTGLDSSTAMELVRTLVGIAGRGKTVLLSLHQPRRDIFEMFDHVIVLCKGGRVVYEGAVQAVDTYLQKASSLGLATLSDGYERVNPADILLDVASESNAFDLAAAFARGDFSDGRKAHGNGDIVPVLAAAELGHGSPETSMAADEDEEVGRMNPVTIHARESIGVAARLSGGRSTNGTEKLSNDFLKTARRRMANPVVQFVVLSTRLVQTAIRNPMLLCLQYFGALFLAVALGAVFRNVEDDLYGVQDRFGLLFFIPFCLVLLGMSSLPVWRDEYILFTHEFGNKRIYGFPAYFLSVIFFDLVLIRTVPPLAFALISYKEIGLNKYCDACLLFFALVLVLTNIISALVAMTIGAFQFSPSFSNLIGSVLSLGFALFGGFLVNRDQMEKLPVYVLDPLAYSYEALMINEFGNQKDKNGDNFYYTINGSWCAKGLTTVREPGNTLLKTFGFAYSQSQMKYDIYSLWTGALYCIALAFTVLLVSSQSTEGVIIIKRALLGVLRRCSSDDTSERQSMAEEEDEDEISNSEDPDISNHWSSILLNHHESLIDELIAPEVSPHSNTETGSTALRESVLDELHIDAEIRVSSNGNHDPPLIVVSFHDIVYEAPGGGLACLRRNIGGARYGPGDGRDDGTNQTSFTASLGAGEIMGMNVVNRKRDNRAVVRKIMAGAWAHTNGIRPMDEIESIAGKSCRYQEVTALLESEARPLEIEFSRPPISPPSPQIADQPRDGNDDGGRKHNVILQGVSGSTVPCVAGTDLPSPLGPMYTAIMGPSGAGKTTLLDILAGRKASGSIYGSVCLNGHPLKPKEMRQISGYVTQEDILPGALTVREYLSFQAQLRIPRRRRGVPTSSRGQAVEKRLVQLNLNGCANSPIGNEFTRGISGGEKRRVSVATELLSEPAILFLDEPTTGLDSTTAVNLTSILRNIAVEGTTVIMSIHQPRLEIFEMVSQVIMLTKDGQVGYCGPTSALAAYILEDLAATNTTIPSSVLASWPERGGESAALASKNPADQFLDVMRSHRPRDIADSFAASGIGEAQARVLATLIGREENEHTSGLQAACAQLGMGEGFQFSRLLSARCKYIAPWLAQFWAISLRCLRNVLRNPYLLVVHGATALVCALGLGLVFRKIHKKDGETAGMQDRFGIMFFLVLYLSLLALTSLPVWREEQRLFKAERGSGIYGASSYVVATVFFDVLPYRILPPLLFTAIAYPMIDLNDGAGHQWRFLATLILFNLVVSGLCMLIGVIMPSNSSANAAGSLVMLTSTLFCGYLKQKSRLPDGLLYTFLLWASPGNYAYETLVVNEFDGLNDLYLTSKIGSETISSPRLSGADISHCFGFTDRIPYNLKMLSGMAAVYFAAVWLAMEIFGRERR